MSSFHTLFTKMEDHTLIITINRPDKLNALNQQVMKDLDAVMDRVYKFPEIKSVVITGAGLKSFVAGADIMEFEALSKEEAIAVAKRGQAVFAKIEHSPKPIIACVNGFALGGGCELAMSCHFRYASENAKLGLPEVTLGVIPGYGGTQRLAQLVGKGKAMEMITSAQMIGAADAKEWGLVNQVVPQEELLNTCLTVAQKIATNSPRAISAALRSVLSGYAYAESGLNTEIKEFGKCFGTADFKEGTTAFMEKRKPTFEGK